MPYLNITQPGYLERVEDEIPTSMSCKNDLLLTTSAMGLEIILTDLRNGSSLGLFSHAYRKLGVNQFSDLQIQDGCVLKCLMP